MAYRASSALRTVLLRFIVIRLTALPSWRLLRIASITRVKGPEALSRAVATARMPTIDTAG